MKYLYLICLEIVIICIGIIKAFDSKKKKRVNAQPRDKSFVVHFITGIPTLIVSLYYALAEPSSTLLLLGTIVGSGIVAIILAWQKKI